MLKIFVPALLLTTCCDQLYAKVGRSPVLSHDPSLPAEAPVIRAAAGPKLDDLGKGFLSPAPISEDVIEFPKGQSIVYVAGGRWQTPQKISHCWVNPEDGGEMVKDLEEWTAKEYARAGIGFTWEGKCTQTNRPQQIRTYFKRTYRWQGSGQISAGGGLSYIGPVNAPLGGIDGQGTMNIEVATDVTGYGSGVNRDWIRQTVRATAVHEFGHALGLAHEQERSDAPVCQDQRGTLPSGGQYLFVGQYDQNSIMNYCKTGPGPASLSEGDITGLRTLYPQVIDEPTPVLEKAFAIRSRANNKCLDLPYSSKTPGVLVELSPCTQELSQAFIPSPSGKGQFELKSASTGLCLDVPGATKEEGAKIQQFSCNKTAAQKWILQARGAGWVSVRNASSNKCLSIEARGSKLIQTSCGYEPTKQFGFFQLTSNQPVSTRL